jgi:3-(3-hydroxy-phenyl)propionate hydroxylase
MHQPDSSPRPSLYFPYQVHSPWVPKSGATATVPVAIVGGGLVGLSLALSLVQQGVPVVVLESALQVSEGSRAIVFTRRTLEILHQLGIAQRVEEKGLAWTTGQSFYRGEPVFRMQVPEDAHDRHAPLTNLQQPWVEQFLLEACSGFPGFEMRWGNQVTDINPAEDGTQLTVDTPEGLYSLNASWVVAADGARSALRSRLGLRLEGTSYKGDFVIADIRIDLPLPTERLAFFEPAWNPGNTVLMHRQPDRLWRVDYQLPEGEDPAAALAPETLRSRIQAQLDSIGQGHLPWTLDWSSVYSARTLTLPDYVRGRVIFAGDAAHLLPIFGVRGANSGFQDAQALAWRLALVVKAHAPPILLESYSQERVGAAREIIEEAGRSTRFMTPPTFGHRALRDATLSLALHEAFARPLLHWRTSRAHAYSNSPLNSAFAGDTPPTAGPLPGDPVPNVRLADDDFLLDRLGHHFTLLYVGRTLPPGLAADCARLAASGLSLWWVNGEATEPGPAARLSDPDGRIAERWGARAPGEAFLVRPDQHLCARWTDDSPGALDVALDRALGKATQLPVGGNVRPAIGPTPLEAAYDRLAEALDAVADAARIQLLVKLALLCADTMGDPAHFTALVERARKSLQE